MRKVDRYGITSSGQQYQGWARLEGTVDPKATASSNGKMTFAEALAWIGAMGGKVPTATIQNDKAARERAIRRARINTHPDHGGNPTSFHRTQEAAAILENL